jgi:hypothetical protein
MDPLLLNVEHDGAYLCPVCGFPFSKHPTYDERGGMIGTGICPCCLWEPGFDDCPAASSRASPVLLETLKDYRDGWAALFQWQGRDSLRPAQFDGRKQLSELLRLAPHLA